MNESSSDSSSSEEDAHVQVSFITDDDRVRISSQAMSIPAHVGPARMSEIINKLLPDGVGRSLAFDFVTGERLIVTSVAQHLAKLKRTHEPVHTIEYRLRLQHPEQQSMYTHPDWISSINTSLEGVFGTGCYDGCLRFWTLEQSDRDEDRQQPDCLFELSQAHDGCINDVCITSKTTPAVWKGDDSANDDEHVDVATGGNDHMVRAWRISTQNASAVCVGVFVGHDSAVQVVVGNPSGTVIASGDFNGHLCLWDYEEALNNYENNSDKINVPDVSKVAKEQATITTTSATKQARKRRKQSKKDEKEEQLQNSIVAARSTTRAQHEILDTKATKVTEQRRQLLTRTPTCLAEAHKACLSAIVWPTTNKLYTAGYDGAIRVWDVEKLRGNIHLADTLRAQETHMVAPSAILCMSVNFASGLVATGHVDRHIRIWDPKQRATTTQTAIQNSWSRQLSAHVGFVCSVRWHAHRSNLLLSCGHDGTVKIWDVSAPEPLYSIEGENMDSVGLFGTDTVRWARILCAEWCEHTEGVFVSGGESCRVRIHAQQQQEHGKEQQQVEAMDESE